jgi:hypothetical protein
MKTTIEFGLKEEIDSRTLKKIGGARFGARRARVTRT